MRQLLTYCPPRMVSAKWTRQLSRSSTCASAAATPPSAITVCALPSSDLQTRPTRAPSAGADHEHVVLVRLVLAGRGHRAQSSLQSVTTPIDTRRTYRSVSATPKRL